MVSKYKWDIILWKIDNGKNRKVRIKKITPSNFKTEKLSCGSLSRNNDKNNKKNPKIWQWEKNKPSKIYS